MKYPMLHPLAATLCTAGLLHVALPALAQENAANDEKSDQKGISEVIVTAQKVAQPALKTAVALTVLSGDDLKAAGLNDARALGDTIPNVHVSKEGGTLRVAIRGVVSHDTSEKGDPSAAFHVDGASVARPEAQGGAFFDIERVEVVRGPQGTLYGRNATAGAINVLTNRPGKTFGGQVNIDVGNYDARRVEGALNVPVNQMFALRAAATSFKRDSYLNPGPNVGIPLNNEDDKAGRLHLLTTFSPDTTLLLTAEGRHVGGGGRTSVPLTNFFTGTVIGRLPVSPPGTGNNILNPVYVDRGTTAQLTTTLPFQPADAHRDNTYRHYRGEFKTALGGMDLTYQVSRQSADTDELTNGVYFGLPFNNLIATESSSTSHELRANSAGAGPLRWVAGLFAYDDESDGDSVFNTYIKTPAGTNINRQPFSLYVTNKSRAAFGQMTWSVRPDTRLTAGVRRTIDEKIGNDELAGAVAPSGSTFSRNAFSAAAKFTNTSWRLGVDHDLGRNLMLYSTLSTGYKAGGFNADATARNYAPEELKSFELGLKGRLLNNRLQLTTSYFNYDYKNMQLGAVVCRTTDLSTCGSITTNASNAKIQGVEAEGKMLIGEGGTLRASMSYTDATFEKYKPNTTDDWSGQRLDRTPRSLVTLGYTHRFFLPNGAELVAAASSRYTGSYMISDPQAGIRYGQPSFTKSDLSLAYESADGSYGVQAYVRNIENQISIEQRLPGAAFVGDPRTFGVRARYSF